MLIIWMLYLCVFISIRSFTRNLSVIICHLWLEKWRPRGEVTFQRHHRWEGAELGFGQESCDLRPELFSAEQAGLLQNSGPIPGLVGTLILQPISKSHGNWDAIRGRKSLDACSLHACASMLGGGQRSRSLGFRYCHNLRTGPTVCSLLGFTREILAQECFNCVFIDSVCLFGIRSLQGQTNSQLPCNPEPISPATSLI